MTTDIHNMDSLEINRLIFGDEEIAAMSTEIAEAVITHPDYEHLDERLRDWAWDSVEFLFPEVPDAVVHVVADAWKVAIEKVAPERAGEVTIQHIEPETLH